ncbi:MAG: tRNA (adenosine(37)-N6)-threonylcarbamoyltransferase complex dimerization subunit type 1 TsaB [Acidobacteriota bacterium]|nr:tRNA (adenosine(37)-N6)-threonylcarbamoyltransferase complex dimerization subunit type 1 TsaB [Acidobacteriota bacterium]
MKKSKDRIILAIETALHPGSVSILDGASEIDFHVGSAEVSRSEDLLPIIAELLRRTGIHQRQVDLIGVSLGPGSFTGVRVGLATAKGLALGIGCECVGVSTLEILAATVAEKGKIRSIISGARREAFYQDFYFEENSGLRKLSDIRVAEIETLFRETDLIAVDTIVLDEKFKQKHLPFKDSGKVKFQSYNPARYVGLTASKNLESGIREALFPQYIQAALEIGKSIKT